MTRLYRLIIALALVGVLLPAIPAQAQSAPEDIDETNCTSGLGGVFGVQASGAKYCILVPPNWNKDLVIFAHGYVDPTMTVTNPEFTNPRIPYEQLILSDNTSTIAGMITQLGYAFAITSYSRNGLAVKEGVADVIDLAAIFKSLHQDTRWVYLVGASEGGIVTTLAIEQNPGNVFSGGVASCGPIGDFARQIDYWGDFRVVFDYFFPGKMPGTDPVTIPPDFNYNNWRIYSSQVKASLTIPAEAPGTWIFPIVTAVTAQIAFPPFNTPQLLNVTGAPIDPADQVASTVLTTIGILSYNVVATNDGKVEMGGIPYNNLDPYKTYAGSDNDTALNAGVARVERTVDPAEMAKYQTSGVLATTLITMHTTGDPIVPYWHETLYQAKLNAASRRFYTFIPIQRYGHCSFKPSEMLFSLWLLVYKSNSVFIPPLTAAAVLPDPAEQSEFLNLVAHASKVYIPNVQKP